MPIRDLREKYGSGKARELVNRAIRAEIPGGAAVLDRLARWRHGLRELVEAGEATPHEEADYRAAVEERDRMADEIARRYGLKTNTETRR